CGDGGLRDEVGDLGDETELATIDPHQECGRRARLARGEYAVDVVRTGGAPTLAIDVTNGPGGGDPSATGDQEAAAEQPFFLDPALDHTEEVIYTLGVDAYIAGLSCFHPEPYK